MSGWISVEDRLPETGQMVIATYKNNYGKWRTIVANYTQRWTEPSNDIETDWNDDISEYHEEKDEYFLLAGWYERIENWGDYEFITVGEGTVTHWIPLPEPPKESPDE